MQPFRTTCRRGFAVMSLLLSLAIIACSMTVAVSIQRRSPLVLDPFDEDFTNSPIEANLPIPAPAKPPKLAEDNKKPLDASAGADIDVKPKVGTDIGSQADSTTASKPTGSAANASNGGTASADAASKEAQTKQNSADPEAKQSAAVQKESPADTPGKLIDTKQSTNIVSNNGGQHQAVKDSEVATAADANQSGGSNNQTLWISLIVVGGVVGLSAVGLMVLRTWKFNGPSRREARLDGHSHDFGYGYGHGHRGSNRGRTYTADVNFVRNLRI